MTNDATQVMPQQPQRQAIALAARHRAPSLVEFLRRQAQWELRDLMALVSRGANVDRRDAEGRSPLMLLAKQGELTAVQYLVGRGAQVNAVDGRGFTAFAEAAWHEHDEVMRYLRSRGANPNAVAPLWQATRQGRLPTVRLLLQHGCSIALTDRAGNAPLMWAAKYNQLELAAFLLSTGAALNRRNRRGQSALDVALSRRHFRIAAFFETGRDTFNRHGLRHARYLWAAWRMQVLGSSVCSTPPA